MNYEHYLVAGSSMNVTTNHSILCGKAVQRLLSLSFLAILILLLMSCKDASKSTGINVDAGNRLVTTEAGAVDNFSIALTSQPTQDVVITVRSNNQNEGLVSSDNISYASSTDIQFSASNWNVPKIVYIQGVNDNVADGNVDYKIVTEPASSGDGGYQSLNAIDVEVTNYSISFDPGQVANSVLFINPVTPLLTSEDGSKETKIEISLNSQPTTNVSVSVVSLDSTEATTLPTQPNTLAFSSADWNVAQTITLIGVDDTESDGDVEYQIIISVESTDINFKNVANTLVTLLSLDNETVSSLLATVIVAPSNGLITGEDQSIPNSTIFSMSLNTSPAVGESITINAVVNNINEATIQPSSALFTRDNWQSGVAFTLTGVDDVVLDGNQLYTTSFTSVSSFGAASPYHDIAIADVQAINVDNEIASVILAYPPNGLLTSENGTDASFTVVLGAAPLADVSIGATSTNVAEGFVSSNSLIFSPTMLSNRWDQPQTITVTGVDDAVIDGTQIYAISLTSNSIDLNFNNLEIPAISAANTDNDSADITVVLPSSGTITTSENLTSDTFSLVLTVAPTSDVVITASSSNLAEATVDPTSLTFSATGANIWSAPQTFTVTGVDDSVLDGVQPYNISLAASSIDVNYDNHAFAMISGVNEDNEAASVNVALPVGGLVTDENGSSARFSVVLASQPSVDVTVSANSLDSSEGVVSPASITFSPSSGNVWNQPLSFTVVGQADNTVDGDQVYSIRLFTSTTDSAYSGIAIPNISATNLDMDDNSDEE